MDDWSVDINLTALWVEVKELYGILANIGLQWTDKKDVVHTIPFIHLFFVFIEPIEFKENIHDLKNKPSAEE